ncbi:unnamed protein product [Dracunculus medinensis]|uniref:Uncharacterized protein n=1 Tax=Dracunculus medinensis TaxID=318479 RepID=A0A0N4U189_DRAME|nr:unnamed protein product [Dracunculus medinensis]
MSVKFGTLTQRLVHPTAPVLLTKNGPLGTHIQCLNASQFFQASETSYTLKSFAPIPESDDRFARQNRFGLPPEFPLASSCSGIVHHLSGTSAYALTPINCMQYERVYVAPLYAN